MIKPRIGLWNWPDVKYGDDALNKHEDTLSTMQDAVAVY